MQDHGGMLDIYLCVTLTVTVFTTQVSHPKSLVSYIGLQVLSTLSCTLQFLTLDFSPSIKHVNSLLERVGFWLCDGIGLFTFINILFFII